MKSADIMTIGKIVATIITVFNLNNLQANKLQTYVNNNMHSWIAYRKNENEIETIIKNKAKEIRDE